MFLRQDRQGWLRQRNSDSPPPHPGLPCYRMMPKGLSGSRQANYRAPRTFPSLRNGIDLNRRPERDPTCARLVTHQIVAHVSDH